MQAIKNAIAAMIDHVTRNRDVSSGAEESDLLAVFDIVSHRRVLRLLRTQKETATTQPNAMLRLLAEASCSFFSRKAFGVIPQLGWI